MSIGNIVLSSMRKPLPQLKLSALAGGLVFVAGLWACAPSTEYAETEEIGLNAAMSGQLDAPTSEDIPTDLVDSDPDYALFDLDGRALRLKRISSSTNEDGDFLWSGESQEDATSATFLRSGSRLRGLVHTGAGSFKIGADAGKPRIKKLKRSTESCGDETTSQYQDTDGQPEFDAEGNAMPPKKTFPKNDDEETTHSIRFLVLYTAAARDLAGGTSAIEADIKMLVEQTKDAWRESGVVHQLVLTQIREVDMDEGTKRTKVDQKGWLYHAINTPGEYANQLRDDTASDVVGLVSANVRNAKDDKDICGSTYKVGADYAREAFFVAKYQCALDQFSLAHELAHVFGARHDWFKDSMETPYYPAHGAFIPYGSGYRRTIMSYEDWCRAPKRGTSCDRIARFSTPDRAYDGKTLGTEGYRNNVLALNRRAALISHFR